MHATSEMRKKHILVLLSHTCSILGKPGLEVIKIEYSLRLKIKRNDWLLVDTCPQAANHCALCVKHSVSVCCSHDT